jgi:hypothetical protein
MEEQKFNADKVTVELGCDFRTGLSGSSSKKLEMTVETFVSQLIAGVLSNQMWKKISEADWNQLNRFDEFNVLNIDVSVFERGDNATGFIIDGIGARIITALDVNEKPSASGSRTPGSEMPDYVIIRRTGQIQGQLPDHPTLEQRLLYCEEKQMRSILRGALQAEYDKQKQAKSARWWKSLSTSLVSLGPLNPSNFALFTLTVLSIALVITAVGPVFSAAFLDAGMVGAGYFGLTSLLVAPFLVYEHYNAQRYKCWRDANLLENKDVTYYRYLEDLHLKDETFKFSFFGDYLKSVFVLAWENKIRMVMVVVAVLLSALLALAGAGFLFENHVAESIMKPFFDVMTSFLSHALSDMGVDLGLGTIHIITAVIAPLFPLVIADTLRRIIDLFDKAHLDAIDKKYGADAEEDWFEERPEFDSLVGMDKSLSCFWSHARAHFIANYGTSPDALDAWEQKWQAENTSQIK